MFKKTFVLIIFALAILSLYNTCLAAADSGVYTYVFHLSLDNGSLSIDKNFKFPYDLVAAPFVQTVTGINPYKGEIVSAQNKTEGLFQFNPTTGKLSVQAPYFSDASKVNFYNNNGQLLLTLNVSGSSVCNDNGVCESSVGENSTNCPNDCPPSTAPTLLPPTSTTPTSSPVSQPSTGNGWAIGLWVFSGVALLAAGIMFFVAQRRQR